VFLAFNCASHQSDASVHNSPGGVSLQGFKEFLSRQIAQPAGAAKGKGPSSQFGASEHSFPGGVLWQGFGVFLNRQRAQPAEGVGVRGSSSDKGGSISVDSKTVGGGLSLWSGCQKVNSEVAGKIDII